MTVEELKSGYEKVLDWMVMREGLKDPKSIAEHERAARRLEEYEDELENRGIDSFGEVFLQLNSKPVDYYIKTRAELDLMEKNSQASKPPAGGLFDKS